MATKLTKPMLIDRLVVITGLTKKQVTQLIEAELELIQTTVASGGEVMLSGFGSFELHDRKARNGIDPNTGQRLRVQATKTPHFKAGAGFKRRANRSN